MNTLEMLQRALQDYEENFPLSGDYTLLLAMSEMKEPPTPQEWAIIKACLEERFR